MLNPTSKNFKVKNWHLGFYSIQTEKLNILNNDLSLEIYYFILSLHLVYIYLWRELQKRCKLNASMPYQIQTYIHLDFFKE